MNIINATCSVINLMTFFRWNIIRKIGRIVMRKNDRFLSCEMESWTVLMIAVIVIIFFERRQSSIMFQQDDDDVSDSTLHVFNLGER